MSELWCVYVPLLSCFGGGVSLTALGPSLNVSSLPFLALPHCVGVRYASVCDGGRGGAVRPLLGPLSPWYPCLGSGALFARPRTRLRGILYGVVRLSPLSLALHLRGRALEGGGG